MNIAVIGSGGREHALCAKLKESICVNKIFCLPGNAGTRNIAENIDVDINDFKKIKDVAHENNIKIIVVGPENPLVNGIVDFFKGSNIYIFGPNEAASRLEGSKIFTKQLCEQYDIPTASFKIFYDAKSAHEYVSSSMFPMVIKADGLASG